MSDTGKPGNTTWAQCPHCTGWFHLSASLIEAREVPLHCPHCQGRFLQGEAARLVRP